MPAFRSPHMGRILSNTPSARPAPGLERAAQALARLITRSLPGSAIGVCGRRGSGKTTLTEATKRRLELDNSFLERFNAWRLIGFRS